MVIFPLPEASPPGWDRTESGGSTWSSRGRSGAVRTERMRRRGVAGEGCTGTWLPLGSPGALVTPLGQALSTGGPAGASSSNINPNGVLKYGFDLNNEFSNDFAPATEQNDCSYTVTANIYQSMTTPGNTAIGGGVAQSWTISNNGSTITFHIRPGLEFSNGQPVTSADVAASLNHTKTSPLRSSLFAISNIQTPDPSTVVVNLSKPTAGDFLWAMTYVDGQIYPASAISTPVDPAGGRRPLRAEELPPGLVDRARQEPQVLGLERLSARRRGLHPGDAGAGGGHRAHVRRGRHDRGRAGELPAAEERLQHRDLGHQVLRLHGDRAAPEHRGRSPTRRCGRPSSTPSTVPP